MTDPLHGNYVPLKNPSLAFPLFKILLKQDKGNKFVKIYESHYPSLALLTLETIT